MVDVVSSSCAPRSSCRCCGRGSPRRVVVGGRSCYDPVVVVDSWPSIRRPIITTYALRRCTRDGRSSLRSVRVRGSDSGTRWRCHRPDQRRLEGHRENPPVGLRELSSITQSDPCICRTPESYTGPDCLLVTTTSRAELPRGPHSGNIH